MHTTSYKDFSVDVWGRALRRESGDFWQARGERMALRLFQAMAARVPAYRDLLQREHIDPSHVKTSSDLRFLPVLDKDSYLRRYPLPMLTWDGGLKNQRTVYAATSGSTGVPYYFPRRTCQDEQYAMVAELYLREFFKIHQVSTLYINCFALGIWIGGLFTYEALQRIKDRGEYELSIANPGTNKQEALKCIEALAPFYDQVIIGGYPPLIKDLLDEGQVRGLEWKKIQLKFVFSAEGFSERFRDYIVERAGLRNCFKDTLNHYGTVDLGTMAHETPTCVFLRRLALERPALYARLFPETSKLPTLAQYLPELFYFEQQEKGLLCSAWSGIPLVRYDLKDQGGIWTFDEAAGHVRTENLSIVEESYRLGINTTLWRLPFVYVYERKDLSVSLSGANIYPETIRQVLLDESWTADVTGKCALTIEHDDAENQQLVIHIELKPGREVNEVFISAVRTKIISALLKDNSEYRVLHETRPERVMPVVKAWPYQYPEFFSPNGKQKWVVKKL